MMGANPRRDGTGQSPSLRRLLEALAFVARLRLSERRFRRHQRAEAHHGHEATRHLQAMVAEMKWREGLIARHGRLPRPSVSRTGSGIPSMPLPLGRFADPS